MPSPPVGDLASLALAPDRASSGDGSPFRVEHRIHLAPVREHSPLGLAALDAATAR